MSERERGARGRKCNAVAWVRNSMPLPLIACSYPVGLSKKEALSDGWWAEDKINSASLTAMCDVPRDTICLDEVFVGNNVSPPPMIVFAVFEPFIDF